MAVLDDPPSGDLLISENQNRLLEDNSTSDNNLEVEAAENLTDDCQNIAMIPDKAESLKNNNRVEKIHVYRRSMTKDSKKGSILDTLTKDMHDSGPIATDGRDLDEK